MEQGSKRNDNHKIKMKCIFSISNYKLMLPKCIVKTNCVYSDFAILSTEWSLYIVSFTVLFI